jgi:ketosteroid isomerase-like protein
MTSIIPKEAQRLLEDATLALAMDEIRLEALNGLANVQADDITAVLRLQQRVQAIEDIRSALQSAANRTNTASTSGSFA